jgi:hypothetical protein
MIPGIVAAQMRVASGAALWTPLNMATVPQIYLDAQDSTVTDVSGFASAISNLGAMGSDGDFSQATADIRPAILAAELNDKRVLSFDGVNDVLLGSTDDQRNIFRNKPAAWGFVVFKKRTADGSWRLRRIFNASNGNNSNPRFAIDYAMTNSGIPNAPGLSAMRIDGQAPASLTATAGHSGSYLMLLCTMDYSTRTGRVYINGSLDAENTALTVSAGNTSDSITFNNLSIGALYNATQPADIDLATLTLNNATPSASDIDKLFGWAAHKYGLTASLPGGHPYKTTAPTV